MTVFVHFYSPVSLEKTAGMATKAYPDIQVPREYQVNALKIQSKR